MCRLQTAAARILLALVFFGLVILKLMAIVSTPNGYLQYQMTLGQFGLPAVFAPLLIFIQLVFGFMLLIGYKTQLSARVLGALAGFMAIILSQASLDAFFAYMGIAGGMWLLSLHPQTGFSLDGRKQ
ncbi:putative oxidoreductase [Methylophilus rhizosphaerae]|uniref:Putative oxidoreductase n=1 Tax=Methylophilus rhizosphaerae TaxID=492660 RepID=A0A1G9DUG7_9PROT|nr:DoxX family membrane protein [Methylophilus rhizosphaerae]SDK67538.1 putative oxidoreductase [Methylophilus rhizosphaerae]